MFFQEFLFIQSTLFTKSQPAKLKLNIYKYENDLCNISFSLFGPCHILWMSVLQQFWSYFAFEVPACYVTWTHLESWTMHVNGCEKRGGGAAQMWEVKKAMSQRRLHSRGSTAIWGPWRHRGAQSQSQITQHGRTIELQPCHLTKSLADSEHASQLDFVASNIPQCYLLFF